MTKQATNRNIHEEYIATLEIIPFNIVTSNLYAVMILMAQVIFTISYYSKMSTAVPI